MRTTLDLDDELVGHLKQRAAESGRTLTELIEDAVRQFLTPSAASKRRYRLRWKPVKGKLQSGVDISDRKSLYDIMEDPS